MTCMTCVRVTLPRGATRRSQRTPFAGALLAPRLAQPAVGDLPHVAMAALRAVDQQGDRLHLLQAGAMHVDVQPGVERLAGLRAAEEERIHRAAAAHVGRIARAYARRGWRRLNADRRLRREFYRPGAKCARPDGETRWTCATRWRAGSAAGRSCPPRCRARPCARS